MFTLIAALLLAARPAAPSPIPEPLLPWIPWVLHGAREASCPFLQAAPDAETVVRCLWPSRLELTLDDRGGTFLQTWTVYRTDGDWVPLPGDEKAWPERVWVDRKPAVVALGTAGVGADADGGSAGLPGPQVHLPPGTHSVTGAFSWASPPASLTVPAATGLVALRLRDRVVERPAREGEKLFLERSEPATRQGDGLELTVVRRLDDSVPARLTTELQLSVSGKGRELAFGPALPLGFVPMSLTGPLPARFEPDGRLRVQLRPGDFTLTLEARSLGPVAQVTEPRLAAPWPAEIVWAFQARPDLRQVAVSGVAAVDPRETRLPEDWQRLPAYRVRLGETLRQTESRRGDGATAPDNLSLERYLWLDEDGSGYTVHDRLRGELHRGLRLDLAPPGRLGRVAIGGQDQPITRLGPGGLPGVEVRETKLDLEADSRLDGAIGTLPAVGWTTGAEGPRPSGEGAPRDLVTVAATLELPPGWRLLHASGVDRASDTFVGRWTLLDLFAVLITALAVGRLFGWGAFGLALAALSLCYQEPDAPRWGWLCLAAFVALARALPEGRLRRLAGFGRLLAALALALTVVPFAIQELRQAIDPVLERGDEGEPIALRGCLEEEPPAQAVTRSLGAFGNQGAGLFGASTDALGGAVARPMRKVAPPSAAPLPSPARIVSYSEATDPNAVVQTGPGLPTWSWRSVRLTFSGPVETGQRIQLYLVPPWLERLLDLLRVALCAWLLARILEVRRGRWPTLWRGRGAAPAVGLALLCALGAGVARADPFPGPDLLAELKKRLLTPPTCAPACASSSRLELWATPGSLRVELDVGASAATAVPLPGGVAWTPSGVDLDRRSAPALFRDGAGTLWAAIPPGFHRLSLEGPIPPVDQLDLTLPGAPHGLRVHALGWSVQGIGDEGEAEGSLTLSRVARPKAGSERAARETGVLPAFVQIERTLRLGLTWTVETKLTRETPLGSPLALAVPLLDGEAVTATNVRVAKGQVWVNLGADQSELSFRSDLAVASPLRLVAPTGVPWVEVWRLEAGPIWHATYSGLPPVHRQDATGARVIEWRPWPGEALQIQVVRPEGIAGPTLTLDGSLLELAPGAREAAATLTLSLRTSRGADHGIVLPEGARLRALTLNGSSEPVRQEGRRVLLSLAPGATHAVLAWTEPPGGPLRFQAPEVDLGAESVNARTHLAAREGRWILLCGGPTRGPAVLFWGVLAALLLLAMGLARLGATPLGTGEWFALGLGFTQSTPWALALFAGWLLALGLRRRVGDGLGRGLFNLGQLVLVAWTAAAALALFGAVQGGLLGAPDMQIVGNGSTGQLLEWYRDRSGPVLPRPWVVSAPLWVYRAAMLAWALWLANRSLRWLRWAWASFTLGGLWRPRSRLAPQGVAPKP